MLSIKRDVMSLVYFIKVLTLFDIHVHVHVHRQLDYMTKNNIYTYT